MAAAINQTQIKHSSFTWLLVSFAIGILLLTMLFWNTITIGQQQTILEIRAITPGGTTPDGFFVSRKLNDNGIGFKSISLKGNILLITFNTHAQSEMAKNMLSDSLPEGFILYQHDENDTSPGWLRDMLRYRASDTN